MTTQMMLTMRAVGRGPIPALAACAALLALPLTARAQVTVDQLELFYTVRGDKPVEPQVFRVNNSGDVPTQVTIRAEDWFRSLEGENRYAPLGTLPASCGARVRAFPSVLQLPPRSSQQVRVWIDSAGATPAACTTILFVETPKAPRAMQAGAALQYSLRYGVKVYVEPPGPVSGEVTGARVEATAKVGAELVLDYANSGARQTLARGTVEIRRPDNSVVQVVAIPEFPVLPGARRSLRQALPEVGAGQYVVLALIDFGGDEIAAGQVEWVRE